MVRQLYMRQALQMVFDQPGHRQGDLPRLRRPDLRAGPTADRATSGARRPEANSDQGPYPFNIAKAKSLLTSHGWTMRAA